MNPNVPLRLTEYLWSATGEAYRSSWASVHSLCHGNGFILFVVATQLVGMVAVIVFNSFLTVMDLTGKPQFLMKYKVQDDKSVPVCWNKYKKCLKRVIFNNTVVATLFQLVVWPLWKWQGVGYGLDPPTLPYLIIHLLFYIVIEEFLFYYLHRLFHTPFLYKRVHKTHHEWTAPVGIAASYCHPLEHFVVNILPIVAGPMVLGSHLNNHLVSEWVWLVIAVFSTTLHHSGYHLPFLLSPEHHDFHHSKFNQMYGVIGLLDYLHGTDTAFRDSKGFKRHSVLLGLKSAKELIPD